MKLSSLEENIITDIYDDPIELRSDASSDGESEQNKVDLDDILYVLEADKEREDDGAFISDERVPDFNTPSDNNDKVNDNKQPTFEMVNDSQRNEIETNVYNQIP